MYIEKWDLRGLTKLWYIFLRRRWCTKAFSCFENACKEVNPSGCVHANAHSLLIHNLCKLGCSGSTNYKVPSALM